MILGLYLLVSLLIAQSVSQRTGGGGKTTTFVLPPQCRQISFPYRTYLSRRGDLEQRCNDGLILQRAMMAHARQDFRTTTSPPFILTQNQQLQKTLIAVIRTMKTLQAIPVSTSLSSQIAGHILNTSCNWIRNVSQDNHLTCSSEELENILVKIELYRVLDDLLMDAPGTIITPLEDLRGRSIGNSYPNLCDFWNSYILSNCTSSPSVYATAAHKYLVERHFSSQCTCRSSPLCTVSGFIDRSLGINF